MDSRNCGTHLRMAADGGTRQPIHVLFLDNTSRNGGPGRSLRTILANLDPTQVRRTVLLPRPGVVADLLGDVCDEMVFEPGLIENLFEPLNREMTREDFNASTPLKIARLLGNLGKASSGFIKTVRRLRSGRFDLIYCNGTSAAFVGAILSQLCNIPVIWHVRWTSVPALTKPLHDRLAASDPVKRLICVSKASAALFPGLESKVSVIHNSVNLDEFDPVATPKCLRKEMDWPADTIILGSHGRVLRRKGYIEFVRAAQTAVDRLTKDERKNIRFVVIGDTPQDFPDDHLAECKALVQSLELEPYVHFLGFRSDVGQYVNDFDIAVVPSVYDDPLPRAVIESMAFGLPVIAFDRGGVPEMVVDGVTGALVSGNPPDCEGLAEQMLRYARDPQLCRDHGRAGRERIEAEFSADQHGARIQAELIAAVS